MQVHGRWHCIRPLSAAREAPKGGNVGRFHARHATDGHVELVQVLDRRTTCQEREQAREYAGEAEMPQMSLWGKMINESLVSRWHVDLLNQYVPAFCSRIHVLKTCAVAWNRAKDKTWREGRLLNTVPVAGAMTPGENDPLFQKGEYTPGVQMTARMSRLWFAGGDEGMYFIA